MCHTCISFLSLIDVYITRRRFISRGSREHFPTNTEWTNKRRLLINIDCQLCRGNIKTDFVKHRLLHNILCSSSFSLKYFLEFSQYPNIPLNLVFLVFYSKKGKKTKKAMGDTLCYLCKCAFESPSAIRHHFKIVHPIWMWHLPQFVQVCRSVLRAQRNVPSTSSKTRKLVILITIEARSPW